MANNLSYLYRNYGVIVSKYDCIKEPTVDYGTYDSPVNFSEMQEKEDKYYNFINFVYYFLGE